MFKIYFCNDLITPTVKRSKQCNGNTILKFNLSSIDLPQSTVGVLRFAALFCFTILVVSIIRVEGRTMKLIYLFIITWYYKSFPDFRSSKRLSYTWLWSFCLLHVSIEEELFKNNTTQSIAGRALSSQSRYVWEKQKLGGEMASHGIKSNFEIHRFLFFS